MAGPRFGEFRRRRFGEAHQTAQVDTRRHRPGCDPGGRSASSSRSTAAEDVVRRTLPAVWTVVALPVSSRSPRRCVNVSLRSHRRRAGQLSSRRLVRTCAHVSTSHTRSPLAAPSVATQSSRADSRSIAARLSACSAVPWTWRCSKDFRVEVTSWGVAPGVAARGNRAVDSAAGVTVQSEALLRFVRL